MSRAKPARSAPSESGPRDRMFVMRMNGEDYEWLERVAEARNVSMAEAIRQLLRREVLRSRRRAS